MQVDRTTKHAALAKQIAQLPFGLMREAARMQLVDGLSYDQIATQLKICPDRVWELVTRAKAELGIVPERVHERYLNSQLLAIPSEKFLALVERLTPSQRRVLFGRYVQRSHLMQISLDIGIGYKHVKRCSSEGQRAILAMLAEENSKNLS